jgi:hypothetical protein
MFPLRIGSEGSWRIGGNLATMPTVTSLEQFD